MTNTSTEDSSSELVMVFDPTTIEHLGIQMYSTLPPVIAELVSNSYDADAKKVTIFLYDVDEKKIIIADDGHGMTFSEINAKFLKIGRNRRRSVNNNLDNQKTDSGNRFAIGKKGIGKLSFFGISKTIQVSTIKNRKENVFILDWEKLIGSGHDYKPEILFQDRETIQPPGTTIELTNIKRKSPFDPHNIAYNLAKTFSIFNENDFNVTIQHNDIQEERIIVKNELKFQNIETEFRWDFPLSENVGFEYENSRRIKGSIISGKETVPAAMKGISLFSRGKLVNEPEFFDEKATSFGYSYLTGWLDIDFVDDWNKDVISTNRRSLNWEDEDTAKLKAYLNAVIRYIYKDQRKKKKEKQIIEISIIAGINVEEWQESLPKHERKLAVRMTDAILQSEGLPTEKQAELVKFIKDSFQFEAFKEFSRDLEGLDNISAGNIVTLLKEWEIIEAREMYKLAIGRIQTIKTLERLINENAKEVEQMHPFFEKFPWILDPRINMFRHELQYVRLLKENYPEMDLDETNRRIDFLCTSVADHRFIIELKRPQHLLKLKDINQAKDYRSFVEEHLEVSKRSPSRIVVYLVGGKIDYNDRKTRDEIDSMQSTDKVYVKTYNQLLTDAKNYHIEFIQRYEEIEKSKNN
ncbi:MAG: ATP-binding protein [Ferruginibacter sp.]